MADVLVVGAGPVGLTMAAELARYGVQVRIIDKATRPTETSKALVLWSRTLELIDRMGCTPQFLEAGFQAHGASFRSGSSLLGQIRLDDVASPYNYALMIPQRDTERLMGAHLTALGVSVERELELVGYSDDGSGVEAHLRHANGSDETTKVSWLIGCDGAHSTVRHGTGIPFSGQPQGDDWLLGDVRLEGPGAPPVDEVAIYLHRDGLLTIFPIPGGRARVVATVGKSDPLHPKPQPTLENIQRLCDQRAGGGFRVFDPVWLSNFLVNERKVSDYRKGHIFLAGDAAHIHSPAGGQGMNTGMQDAINLSWKLAMVVKGAAPPALLDSYSPERNAVGEMVLRNATRMTEMATLHNPAAQAVRNLALRFVFGFHGVQDKIAVTMTEIEIAYGDSPISTKTRHGGSEFAAGSRLDPSCYDGPPPGTGTIPRFVLFAADKEKGALLAARHPQLIEATVRTPPDPELILIVRPDCYIGLSAGEADWEEVGAYLAGLAISPLQ
jgi:2-polyprenyl-6-methoxyphenol hydroxylase-like FAD-dependent oxidoreductase